MHSCTDNEYLRGQLRQDTSDCAAYRRTHKRTGCEGFKRDGANGRWGERVCEDTELERVSNRRKLFTMGTHSCWDGRSGSEALQRTEDIYSNLI